MKKYIYVYGEGFSYYVNNIENSSCVFEALAEKALKIGKEKTRCILRTFPARIKIEGELFEIPDDKEELSEFFLFLVEGESAEEALEKFLGLLSNSFPDIRYFSKASYYLCNDDEYYYDEECDYDEE